MIEEFLMPLERQFDSGFGATANAFHEAAKAIDTEEHSFGFGLSRSRLPVLYLYRHANELYLKSILTILHRRFGPHYPRIKSDDFPVITVKGKSKKIYDVHSILNLYSEFRGMLSNNASLIKGIGKTDWTDVPDGLDEIAELIDNADKVSTMFRYPITLDTLIDAKKSSFKDIHPVAALAKTHAHTDVGKSGVFIVAVENDDGEIVNTFIHDEDPMPDVYEALKKLSNTLASAKFGMLTEFLDYR